MVSHVPVHQFMGIEKEEDHESNYYDTHLYVVVR